MNGGSQKDRHAFACGTLDPMPSGVIFVGPSALRKIA
jgi:hypothetical protein